MAASFLTWHATTCLWYMYLVLIVSQMNIGTVLNLKAVSGTLLRDRMECIYMWAFLSA